MGAHGGKYAGLPTQGGTQAPQAERSPCACYHVRTPHVWSPVCY